MLTVALHFAAKSKLFLRNWSNYLSVTHPRHAIIRLNERSSVGHLFLPCTGNIAQFSRQFKRHFAKGAASSRKNAVEVRHFVSVNTNGPKFDTRARSAFGVKTTNSPRFLPPFLPSPSPFSPVTPVMATEVPVIVIWCGRIDYPFHALPAFYVAEMAIHDIFSIEIFSYHKQTFFADRIFASTHTHTHIHAYFLLSEIFFYRKPSQPSNYLRPQLSALYHFYYLPYKWKRFDIFGRNILRWFTEILVLVCPLFCLLNNVTNRIALQFSNQHKMRNWRSLTRYIHLPSDVR